MTNQKEVTDALNFTVDDISGVIQEYGKLNLKEKEEKNKYQEDSCVEDKKEIDSKYVCFTSHRNGHGQQTHLLGLYERIGMYNDIRCYKQIDSTKNSASIFAFQDAENIWSIRASVNPSSNDWILDPSISITKNDEKKVCGNLLLSTFDDDVADRWPDCIGSFYPTFKYRHGRLVFKHINNQIYLYLMKTDNFCSWVVGPDPETDSLEDVCIILGSNSSSMCPESGSGDFIINCDVHGY